MPKHPTFFTQASHVGQTLSIAVVAWVTLHAVGGSPNSQIVGESSVGALCGVLRAKRAVVTHSALQLCGTEAPHGAVESHGTWSYYCTEACKENKIGDELATILLLKLMKRGSIILKLLIKIVN
ncbi:hypothetical protein DPMN_185085 [Dreissena polymorpha]|uniref:Uncharacterized protein n=1 Tax=Dreissena polymorpha TaxID=45954 RepID=A0A9D4DKE8_DREPO|nr:hypothetical protein DPMN_185085 [Dreissena polymorpha]